MKARRRNRREEETNFWTSFVDVMSTVSLVFFFIMVISIAITYTKYKEIRHTYDQIDDIAKQRKELYEQVEKTLKPKLGDNISFNEGKLEIKTEVLFQQGKYDLTTEGKVMAQQISEAFYELLENPKHREKIESIEVRGHTDNLREGSYNRFLSTNRSANFMNAMIPDGSKYEKYAGKFKASGMSKFVPKSGTVDKQSGEDREQNRRIEIYINIVDDDISDAINKLINENKK